MCSFVRQQSGGADLFRNILPLSLLKCTNVNTIGNSVMFEQAMATYLIESLCCCLLKYGGMASTVRSNAPAAKLNVR